MKEYIERESLIKIFTTNEKVDKVSLSFVRAVIKNAAPAADVVEVVRCKDCDVPHNKWIGCRYLNGLIPPPDFYCACGKRKNDKEE